MLRVLCGVLVISQSFVLPSQCKKFSDADFRELQLKYTTVVNELDDMRATLKTVIEDTTRVGRISRALDALCREWGDNPLKTSNEGASRVNTQGPGNSSQEQSQTSESVVASAPIQILSVETREDNSFQIEYAASGRVNITAHGHIEIEDSWYGGYGVIEGNVSASRASVRLKSEHFRADVKLKPGVTSAVSFDPFRMDVNVLRVVVFQQEKSTEIVVRVANADFDKSHFSNHMFTENRNETGQAMLTNEDFPGIVNLSRSEDMSDHRKFVVTVNKDHKDHEGSLILKFSFSYNRDDNSPVDYIGYSFVKLVRRSDHDQVFPHGFIGFLVVTSYDGPVECYIGEDCEISEMIYGREPKNITLLKNSPDGYVQVNASSERRYYRMSMTVRYKLTNISQFDSGSYVWEGSSKMGKVVSRGFQLRVNVPAEIIRERSEVVVDDPEMLKVRCVAKGSPIPEIVFTDGFRELSEGIIFRSKEKDKVSIATLTLDPREVTLTQIKCVARGQRYGAPQDEFLIYNKS